MVHGPPARRQTFSLAKQYSYYVVGMQKPDGDPAANLVGLRFGTKAITTQLVMRYSITYWFVHYSESLKSLSQKTTSCPSLLPGRLPHSLTPAFP